MHTGIHFTAHTPENWMLYIYVWLRILYKPCQLSSWPLLRGGLHASLCNMQRILYYTALLGLLHVVLFYQDDSTNLLCGLRSFRTFQGNHFTLQQVEVNTDIKQSYSILF